MENHMSSKPYKKLVFPNIADRRVNIYPNENPETEQPIVMMSGTKEGWLNDKEARETKETNESFIKRVTERGQDMIDKIVLAHKTMLDGYVTPELLDHIRNKDEYKYTQSFGESLPKLTHDVSFEWYLPDHQNKAILRVGNAPFTLVVIFEPGQRCEYGFSNNSFFHTWDMMQVMGEYRALDSLSQFNKATYAEQVTKSAHDFWEIVDDVYDELSSEGLGITLEAYRHQKKNDNLRHLLERFNMIYTSKAQSVLKEFKNITNQHSVDIDFFDTVALFRIKLGWLTFTMTIPEDGELAYHMSVLNESFSDIVTLVNVRFSHLSSVSSWDIHRDILLQLEALEKHIVSLTKEILEANKHTGE